MIRCAYGYKGRGRVVFLDGKVNALKYSDRLTNRKSFFRQIARRNRIFQ